MSYQPQSAFLTFLRAFVPFGFMGSMNYSFANPDEDNIYDVFPVQKSKYAFISGYAVPVEKRQQFEQRWRDLARFYQKQEGYLFNKLIRQDMESRSKHKDETDADKSKYIVYLDFNQWTSGDAYKMAATKSIRIALWDAIQDVCDQDAVENFKQPMMYKSVVDDTQFTPSEVVHARNYSNVSHSMNTR